ncbi:MAG: DUF4230 domain-containing protein [Spirochaetaceae bacterium]
MKKYIILVLSIIIIILAFVFIPSLNKLDINPFQRATLTQTSHESIKTVKIAQFRSSKYTYKTIFPFDFIHGEPNWGTLLYKNAKFLSTEDIENKNFFYQCKNIGIDLNKDKYFFIITTQAVAGFDMESYLKNPILFSDEEIGLIEIKSPESKILSLEVEDTSKAENFPDINITPGQWQKLITLLLPKIKDEIINRGLIKSAEESNRAFLEKLFISIGWNSVEFK